MNPIFNENIQEGHVYNISGNNNNFEMFMITYMKNKLRVENYHKQNKLLNNNLKLFTAIDTINNYNYWNNYAIANKLKNPRFNLTKTGELGCSLSHQLLLRHIKNNNYYGKRWFLIMEDDVEICTVDFEEHLNNMVLNFDRLKTNFVQMAINYYSKKRQLTKKNHIIENIYKLSHPQYGTVAYMISRTGIDYILKYKVNENIDQFFSKFIKPLKSIFYHNDILKCDTCDIERNKRNKTKFGSLLVNSISLPKKFN